MIPSQSEGGGAHKAPQYYGRVVEGRGPSYTEWEGSDALRYCLGGPRGPITLDGWDTEAHGAWL